METLIDYLHGLIVGVVLGAFPFYTMYQLEKGKRKTAEWSSDFWKGVFEESMKITKTLTNDKGK